MNKAKMEKLRDTVVLCDDSKFNMLHWCGTACCLAGHTLLMEDIDPEEIFNARLNSFDVEIKAAMILDLDPAASNHFFVGMWYEEGLDKITRTEAVVYLNNVLEKGSVFV